MSASPRLPVAVVGSCIMDFCVSVPRLPRLGENVIASGLRISHGGKGANQAVALARLGAAPRLVATVGDDDFGRSFRTILRAEGVVVDLVGTSTAPTGIGVPMILGGGENAIVVALGAAMSLRPEAVNAARREIAASAALLLQLEVPLDSAIAAMEIARAAGVEAFLNAGPIVEGAEAACRAADVLVVNETEAEALAGGTIGDGVESALEAAAALHRLGPAVVVVTLGERGAVWSAGAGLGSARGDGGVRETERGGFVPGFRVAAVDPTGAGDAFCAGLVWYRIHGAAWRPAVELANACGALAATAVGAMAALPDRAAAEALVASGESATGIVTRMPGTRSRRSVPARSSSSTLLSGSSARPKPASTMRFCAVRLSIGRISEALRPQAASRCSSADEYGSRAAPGRGGNEIQRSPDSASGSTRCRRARRCRGEHTGTIGSSWIADDTRSGCGSTP